MGIENSWRKKFRPVRDGVSPDEFRGKSGNILVLAPHPDDDILGAGGTMAEASGKGQGVFSIYLTDGRGSPRLDPSTSDEEMAARREKEAMAALKAVGAIGGFFLAGRSSELEGEGGRIREVLLQIIQWVGPSEVYLPAPYERHATHQKCTSLTIEALRSSGLKPGLFGYSLWGCFWGGKKRVVRDITPYIRKKVEAVLAHGSQIAYKNYQQGILGKNNFEAIFWESHERQEFPFAENFLDMDEFLERRDLTLEAFIREDLEAFIRAFIPPSPFAR